MRRIITIQNILVVISIIVSIVLAVFSFASGPIDFQVHGVDPTVKENILTRLHVATKYLKKEEEAFQTFYQEVPSNIQKAMQPYGYFEPQIQTKIIKKKPKPLISIKIKPGRQMRIQELNVKITGAGKEDPEFLKLLSQFPLRQGQFLLIKDYNKAKTSFFHVAETRGYLQARMVQNRILIDLKQYTARVTLHFDTGKRYFFGPVHFNTTPFSNNFLQRYVHFQENQVYSTEDLLALQDHLNNSNFFQQVEIKPALGDLKNQTIPINVYLVPRKSQQYTFGFGYGTDTQLRGTLGWNWRRITPTGHHLQALLQGSFVQSSLQTTYIIPGKNPVSDEYHISAALFHQNLKSVDSVAAQLGAAYLSNWKEWQRTIGISTLFERRFNQRGVPDKTTNWVYPDINLRRIHADDALNTTNGYKLNINFKGAAQELFSDETFAQVKIQGKYIKGLNQKNRLITRGTIGYTAIDQINNLAPSLQFYTGGSQTVRGYKYHSLGPGRYLFAGSMEWQHLIRNKWSIAVFFDAGNVSNSLRTKLKRGIGFGLVRSSTIGAINIGLAKPLDARNKSFQFIFSMGPDLS